LECSFRTCDVSPPTPICISERALRPSQNTAIVIRRKEQSLTLMTTANTNSYAAVAQLEAMASESPNSAIQHTLNGAKGAVLVYEGNYDTALPLLERDNNNAFSL